MVFILRRAIERLRDGLYDSTAVSRLTMEEEQVIKSFSKGLKALEKGQAEHLCICGSYGQGKSHNLTYLRQQALAQGYATSLVQLDIREVPFHQFPIVYQSLMEQLTLPDGVKFAEAWKKWGESNSLEILNAMPHRLQMILRAMLSKSYVPIEKNKDLRPKDFSHWLEEALQGRDLRLAYFKQILKSRAIEGYQKHSLACRGNLPYVEMVQALGKLLKEIGYKGWVLFFDEGEAIAQVRLSCRIKSYEVLQQFFTSKESVYPVFAFTEGFFDQVNREEYENEAFKENYAEAWKGLNIVRLEEASSSRWETLKQRLIELYAEAYQIDLSHQMGEISIKLQNLLEKLKAQETRYKLKALVNQLDIETQNLSCLP